MTLSMKGEYTCTVFSKPRKTTEYDIQYAFHRRALIAGDPKAHQIELDIIAKRTTLAEQYPLDAETLEKLANQPDPSELFKDIEIKGVYLKGGKPSAGLEYKVKITATNNLFNGNVKFEIVHPDSEEVIDNRLYKELNKALAEQVLIVLQAKDGVKAQDSERLYIDTVNELADNDPRYKGCIYIKL